MSEGLKNNAEQGGANLDPGVAELQNIPFGGAKQETVKALPEVPQGKRRLDISEFTSTDANGNVRYDNAKLFGTKAFEELLRERAADTASSDGKLAAQMVSQMDRPDYGHDRMVARAKFVMEGDPNFPTAEAEVDRGPLDKLKSELIRRVKAGEAFEDVQQEAPVEKPVAEMPSIEVPSSEDGVETGAEDAESAELPKNWFDNVDFVQQLLSMNKKALHKKYGFNDGRRSVEELLARRSGERGLGILKQDEVKSRKIQDAYSAYVASITSASEEIREVIEKDIEGGATEEGKFDENFDTIRDALKDDTGRYSEPLPTPIAKTFNAGRAEFDEHFDTIRDALKDDTGMYREPLVSFVPEAVDRSASKTEGGAGSVEADNTGESKEAEFSREGAYKELEEIGADISMFRLNKMSDAELRDYLEKTKAGSTTESGEDNAEGTDTKVVSEASLRERLKGLARQIAESLPGRLVRRGVGFVKGLIERIRNGRKAEEGVDALDEQVQTDELVAKIAAAEEKPSVSSAAEAPVAEAPTVDATKPEAPAAETQVAKVPEVPVMPVAEVPEAKTPVVEAPKAEKPAAESAETETTKKYKLDDLVIRRADGSFVYDNTKIFSTDEFLKILQERAADTASSDGKLAAQMLQIMKIDNAGSGDDFGAYGRKKMVDRAEFVMNSNGAMREVDKDALSKLRSEFVSKYVESNANDVLTSGDREALSGAADSIERAV